MNRALAVAGVALAVSVGCAAQVQCPAQVADSRNGCSHGIPNLQAVEESEPAHHLIFRGGQPTQAGWDYLHDTLHIETVIKLNDSKERPDQGEDDLAKRLGMRVIALSLPPRDLGLVPSSLFELLRALPDQKLAMAIAVMADDRHGNVYVHCSHGRDRTGLIVGLYRVLHDGWEPKRAYAEMDSNGFRPLNLNLRGYWATLFDNADGLEARQHRAHLQAEVEQCSVR